MVHDVAIQNLPVRFAIDRAGLVGADGCTHAGSFDLAYLCTLPNMVVMAAADEVELTNMVHTMALHDSGPIAVRYPRGNGRGLAIPAEPTRLAIGKGRIVKDGKTVAILSLGTRLEEAEKAAAMLEARGLSTTVADMRFAKPLDEELIRKLLTTHEVAVTIEEASVGGFGLIESTTARRPSRASCERIEAIPARYIFLLIFCVKFSSGIFGKIRPPPRHRGEDVIPARARPVPFCLNGFLVEW